MKNAEILLNQQQNMSQTLKKPGQETSKHVHKLSYQILSAFLELLLKKMCSEQKSSIVIKNFCLHNQHLSWMQTFQVSIFQFEYNYNVIDYKTVTRMWYDFGC